MHNSNDETVDKSQMRKELQKTLSVKLKQKNKPAQPTTCTIGPITCFVLNGEQWQKNDLPADKDQHSLNAILTNAGLPATGTNNIELKRFNHFWFANFQMEMPQASFSGAKRHQDIIINDSSSFLQCQTAKIIITTRNAKTSQQEELKVGPPEAGEIGVETPRGEFRYPSHKTLLIGSNPTSDIVFEGKPFSALISTYKNNIYINNLCNDQILINEEKMKSSCVQLQHNSLITINEQSLRVKLPQTPLDQFSDKLPEDTLCLLDTDSTGDVIERIFLPNGKALTFGRGSISDVVLDVKSISRKHAQLIIYDDHVLVLDCYSKNGTFINDNNTGRGRAHPGDLITFSNKSYLLCYYNG